MKLDVKISVCSLLVASLWNIGMCLSRLNPKLTIFKFGNHLIASTLTILLWLKFKCCRAGANSKEQSIVVNKLYEKSAVCKLSHLNPVQLSPPQCDMMFSTDSMERLHAISTKYGLIRCMPTIRWMPIRWICRTLRQRNFDCELEFRIRRKVRSLKTVPMKMNSYHIHHSVEIIILKVRQT